MKKSILISAMIASLGCVAAFAQGSTGTTSTTTTTNFVFPPVGLASGETMAVSLTNIAPASTSSTATAPSCTGTVTFAGPTGTVMNTGGKATAFTVGNGAIDTVSLPSATSGMTASRVEVLSVQQTITRPATAPCSLVFSLEVYDSNGITHVFLGNTAATTPPALSASNLFVH